MIELWRGGFALESIRFAARNRLVVDLGYGGRTRLIEPYSLRYSRAGALLLYAWKIQDREIHSYRADRITGVRVTNRPFAPRFRIQL